MAVRCRARRNRGHLRRAGIRLQTWRWYRRALLDLITFFCEHFPHSLPRAVKEFNELLGEYANFLYQEDCDIQHCRRHCSSVALPTFFLGCEPHRFLWKQPWPLLRRPCPTEIFVSLRASGFFGRAAHRRDSSSQVGKCPKVSSFSVPCNFCAPSLKMSSAAERLSMS